MKTKLLNTIKISILAAVLSFGLSYVYAWTAPSATPPTGNVSAPINTSGTTQIKEGGLDIDRLVIDLTGNTSSAGRDAIIINASADNTTGVILANKPTITFWSTVPNTLADINAKNGIFSGNVGLGYEIVTASAYSGNHFNVDAYCPAGKVVIGGGCNQQGGSNRALVDNNPIGSSGWHCRGRDVDNWQAVTATTYAICARVQ